VEQFLSKHANAVIGTLSGFDRLVLRQLSYRTGMAAYLWAKQVLLKDFASHAEALTRQLREASEQVARQAGRRIHHLASAATNKEQIGRDIAKADGITQELALAEAGDRSAFSPRSNRACRMRSCAIARRNG
jgi:hypothetical protein